MGKILAQGFIPHWANVANDQNNPEVKLGKKFTETPKVVFTKTLDKSDWENTVLAKGEIVDEINKLKNQEGKDIIVYGGGSFVSSLIKENLIDEYHFFINPVVLGKGMSIFKGVEQKLNLEFVNSFPFECGITVNKYKKKEEK